VIALHRQQRAGNDALIRNLDGQLLVPSMSVPSRINDVMTCRVIAIFLAPIKLSLKAQHILIGGQYQAPCAAGREKEEGARGARLGLNFNRSSGGIWAKVSFTLSAMTFCSL